MVIYRQNVRIIKTVHVSNMEVSRKVETTNKFSIRKSKLIFLEHIIRNVGLENLTPTGHIESKNGSRNQRLTYLTSSCEWMGEYGQ